MALSCVNLCMLWLLLFAAQIHAGNYSTLSDAIPQLANLTQNPPTKYAVNLGGANTTHCCLLAVNESFTIENGDLALNSPTYLDPSFTLAGFESSSANGQFPCGAKYNGNRTGAPVIQVSYDWCNSNCGGWEISQYGNLQQWIGPMVGFILPSLVFCLSIPRRRKLLVEDRWFKPKPSRTNALLTTIPRAAIAAFLVSLDTLIWLCICFAAAGPMIFSGIYEAWLDSEILDAVRKSLSSHSLTTDMRARLLLIILVGNFDMKDGNGNGDQAPRANNDGGGNPNASGVALNHLSHNSHQNSRPPAGPSIQPEGGAATNGHVGEPPAPQAEHMAGALQDEAPQDVDENNLRDIKGVIDPDTEHLATWDDVEKIISKLASNPGQTHDENVREAQAKSGQDIEASRLTLEAYIREIALRNITADEKRAALDEADQAHQERVDGIQCELDTFIATANQNLVEATRKRDRAIGRVKTRLRTMLSTQYSFGSAIGAPVVFFAGAFIYTLVDTLSRLGDNDTAHALAFGMWWMTIPHVAIVAGLLLGANNPNTLEGIVGKDTTPGGPHLKILALAYPSTYKTEWMWFRGRSKRQWIERVLSKQYENNDLDRLRRKTKVSFNIWMYILGASFFLIAVPFVLAFLTSFYTPRVGLACRSLTFLMYALLQLLQMLLWVWVFTCSETDKKGVLHSPTNIFRTEWTDYKEKEHRPRALNKIACLVWWSLAIIFGLGSIFTEIGGTMMQILGVYRNCLCSIPIRYWSNRHASGAYLYMSTSSRQDIKNANTFWKGTGAAAVVFLGITCYAGWWYQRRLRYNFRSIAEHLEGYEQNGH